jgi:hypothetical protein
VVVLNEIIGDAKLLEDATAVRLEKEAASISMDHGLDQYRPVQAGREGTHRGKM